MKKTLLGVVTFMSLSLLSLGQTFSTQYPDTASAASNSASNIEVYNIITNTSSSDINIRWKVLGSNISSGWNLEGFCDNKTCYTTLAGVENEVSNPYVAGMQGDCHAIFGAANAPVNSSAWIRVSATDTANSSSTKTLTFIAYKFATNVVGVTKSDDEVVLYPNPARSHVNLIFSASLGVKNIAIYNMIGKMVDVYRVNGNSAKLELNEVPAGIYFVRLMNAQGQIVATRKFTHQ
jgi:hypothetical protein